MASRFEMGERRVNIIVADNSKKPLLYGLRGEDLSTNIVRPSQRHTNGAKEARKAQQF